MRLQVSRWGNSLAVRLPVECTRATGLKEGDSVEASITPAGEITLTPERAFDKTDFLTRIAKLHEHGLSAGDSLPLAVAVELEAMATLDGTLAANAKRNGMELAEF